MDTFDALFARRNVREFSDRAIAPDDLDRILEAARRTPSSRNTQPWDFVVVTDEDRLQELTQLWKGAWHVAGAAAAIALVAPKGEAQEHWIYYDLGQATMSIMAAAAALGIGTAHASVTDQELAQRLLGYPDGHFTAALISLGYPADRPLAPLKKPNRKPFDEVVHREAW